ncbi:MAG: hypothetical protein F7B20_04720 [Aeropyrum sp.]|nr:hypothetical protein [Aeropyrum sp.]MCE4616783.1 hypothetical protein [Aeropyrum sp.]
MVDMWRLGLAVWLGAATLGLFELVTEAGADFSGLIVLVLGYLGVILMIAGSLLSSRESSK